MVLSTSFSLFKVDSLRQLVRRYIMLKMFIFHLHRELFINWLNMLIAVLCSNCLNFKPLLEKIFEVKRKFAFILANLALCELWFVSTYEQS